LRGLVFALCLGATASAWAQRVQFPTMVDGSTTGALSPPATSSSILSPSTSYYQAPAGGTTFDPYSIPSQTAPTYAPATTPGPFATPSTAPAPYSPYAASPYAPPPAVPAYTPAYSGAPAALYPEGIAMPTIFPAGAFSVEQPLRLLQEVRGRWTWLSPMGSNSLGVNDVETSATFAFPFLKTSNPLLITPGFGIHFFEGPVTEDPDFADLPPNTYDAYLDTAWHPQITPWLGANLGVRVGAYSDFQTFNTHSIRIMGRGLGVVTLTPTLKLALGVVYIDRVLIKLFPAGGLIWTPNPDARYEILFPNPKLAHRWTTLGNTDLWGYISGEYGGGSWTIERIGDVSDQADYNDIRVNLGLEGYGYRGLHGFFEVGYVFERQIIYRSGSPNYFPSDTVMLRAGLEY
jgi:hypothetical protein